MDHFKSSSSNSLVSAGKKRKHSVSSGPQDDVQASSDSPPTNVESDEFVKSNVAAEVQKNVRENSTSKRANNASSVPQAANKFCGKSLNKIYVLEIFAGSARLSKAALVHGFASIGIDHKSDRSCGVAIQHYDMTDPSHLDSFLVFIKENKDDIAMVWMAPPCGRASKARERPLKRLEQLGMKIPKPLRSKDQPDQLDGLGGVDKIKTEAANILYEAVRDIGTLCFNSHFWATSPIDQLRQTCKGHYVSFHNCCHGGDRDKLLSLWVTANWLDDMEATCEPYKTRKTHQFSYF